METRFLIKNAMDVKRMLNRLSSRLDGFDRRHFVLMTLITLTLAILATIALVRDNEGDRSVIIYKGF